MRLICDSPALHAQALILAERYGFDLEVCATNAEPQPFLSEQGQEKDYLLELKQEGLFLRPANDARAAVQVDFCGGATAHRRQFGGGKGQDIAKAVGISAQYQPSVVDATAGLGRDAFVLATLGCQVKAFERKPEVAALLEDGLNRALQQGAPDVVEIVSRISMTFGSSHELLVPPSEGWLADVVYLDPMFAHDEKQTAAVKKDMQAFRSVVGQDNDADHLLAQALACARCRVVVKRARKAEPLAGKTPSYSLVGKANRFDVYALAKVAPVHAKND
ncbi:MAG: class I SAM-dependent methyltransferase [Oleibacter sp.]|nr:class I SAM-dependent methyltransferase [Thalassolituus sp.]